MWTSLLLLLGLSTLAATRHRSQIPYMHNAYSASEADSEHLEQYTTGSVEFSTLHIYFAGASEYC